MDNITRIAETLRKNDYIASPHQAAEDLSILSGEYAWVMGQLEIILQNKPHVWTSMRKEFKSDTACERAWQATELGVNEMGLRLREKSIGKMMSALKTLIRLAENESKNLT
jgi:hypothetical protein